MCSVRKKKNPHVTKFLLSKMSTNFLFLLILHRSMPRPPVGHFLSYPLQETKYNTHFNHSHCKYSIKVHTNHREIDFSLRNNARSQRGNVSKT